MKNECFYDLETERQSHSLPWLKEACHVHTKVILIVFFDVKDVLQCTYAPLDQTDE
jgi:hypothetical protein